MWHITVQQAPYKVSEHLHKNLVKYGVAILLSPQLAAYKGRVPVNILMNIVKKHCFDIPANSEKNQADMDTLKRECQDVLTQLRGKFKKQILASVGYNAENKTVAAKDDHQNIFVLTTVMTNGSNCVVTVELVRLNFALQFARATGATTIVLSSSPAKLAVATTLGATHTINYAATPNWDQRVRELTGGRGVDRVIEVVGNATLERSIASARFGGSIDVIGLLGGLDHVPPVDIIAASIWKQLKFRGIYVGAVSQFIDMTRLMIANPDITRPLIDKVFPFEQAKDAFAYLKSQKHVGKVVVKVV
ncbi:Alcohol dehydrogenase superfamily protein [Mycena kentingensis (nom. inval.)]|nr:Alcohol dehydrogenase superfamily protein [Mycena kentingensis (nom. inval.)]